MNQFTGYTKSFKIFAVNSKIINLNTYRNNYCNNLIKADRVINRKIHNWGEKVVRMAPKSLEPYMKLIRIDKPTGTYLLFWPCAWGLAIATPAGTIPSLAYLTLFFTGSLILRGAGCIVNDIWDRKLDVLVERTKSRPLAAGEITVARAIYFFSLLFSAGICILSQFNSFTVKLCLASVPIVLIYPTFKRFFKFPQLVLGIVFNWGILVGWTTLYGTLSSHILPFYVGCIFWTIYYDTIYAHQDKADDIKVGINSSALTIGDRYAKEFSLTFMGMFLTGFVISANLLQLHPAYYASVILVAMKTYMEINAWKINNSDSSAQIFKNTFWDGIIVFFGIVIGVYLSHPGEDNEKIKCKLNV